MVKSTKQKQSKPVKDSRKKIRRTKSSSSDSLFSGLLGMATTAAVLGSLAKKSTERKEKDIKSNNKDLFTITPPQTINYGFGWLCINSNTMYVSNDKDKLRSLKLVGDNKNFINVKVYSNNSITCDFEMYEYILYTRDGLDRIFESSKCYDKKILEKFCADQYLTDEKGRFYLYKNELYKLFNLTPFRFDGLKLVVVQ